ncbi:membrane protein insertase YidC [Corynebacterium sp. ZY180755]
MLNFIYWPISAVLWFWHKVVSFVLNPDSGLSWVLAIILLTFTIRALLVKPMVNQMRSMRKMQEVQPLMQEIRNKYKNDQQKMLEETRKIQKDMGVNPLAGCLPMLVQIPVFIGLFHVLRSFNRTGTGAGQLGMSFEENRNTANYIFSPEDVQSFLDARLFNVPLSAYISMPQEMYQAFQPVDFDRARIALVAAPLILIIVLATHMNARLSVNRQQQRLASGKQKPAANAQMQMQTDMMNKMMLWFMPLTILFTGVLWHIGLLFYMVSNNVWTFFQQRLVFAAMDREEEAELQAKRDAKRASAPKPGQRPNNPKRKGGKKR